MWQALQNGFSDQFNLFFEILCAIQVISTSELNIGERVVVLFRNQSHHFLFDY